jgi:hypothetical protein
LQTTKTHFLNDRKFQVIIISLMVALFYGNTLSNQFALDDGMVILENKFVLKGISGIPDILTHDSFYGAIGNSENLSGGRYRPLSLVAFAIENEMAGTNPFVFHLFNVIYSLLTCIVFLSLLRKFLFKDHPLAAFAATILFTIHPIHTEVVANIKSRDELFSLLFLLLTLFFLLQYCLEQKKAKYMLLSLLCFSLALLSKENGIIFAAIIPATIYFFTHKKPSSIIALSLPFWGVLLGYLLLRHAVLVPNPNEVKEVMDNPYLLASPLEKYATILLVLLRYLQLLFWPHPLTYDYSYNQIPYVEFSAPIVWISIAVHLLMLAVMIVGFRNKNILSWCMLVYLSGMLLVSNIFINIGAPMAERFLFQSSAAFAIALTAIGIPLFHKLKGNEKLKSITVTVFLLPVIVICGWITIERNKNWHSNETLFLHDVKISSRSARANAYAGVALIKLCDQAPEDSLKRMYATSSLQYLKIADDIKPQYITTLLNMGVAYSRLDSVQAAEAVWEEARIVSPGNKKLIGYDKYLGEMYYKTGMEKARNKELFACIADLEKAVRYDPNNTNGWYNLGGAYFTTGEFDKAKRCWEKTLQLNPEYENASAGLKALESQQQ